MSEKSKTTLILGRREYHSGPRHYYKITRKYKVVDLNPHGCKARDFCAKNCATCDQWGPA